jgi:DNA-3-methyladenine glycosylase
MVSQINEQWIKLPVSFYERENAALIASALIGKILITQIGEILTAARIVETEAYNGITDKASHAYGNRRTTRTEIMYANGGVSYVYLCYGIHHLFNVVTNSEEVPHAVLIRAAEPITGIAEMLRRTGKHKLDYSLASGPGNLTKALGISTAYNGISLTGNTIFIAADDIAVKPIDIIATPRIGVDYAGEDALLPYRFILKGNPFISGKK